MKSVFRTSVVIVALLSANAFAGQEAGVFGPGQAIADEIRSATDSDIAWIAGGLLKQNASRDLVSQVQFSSDTISVVNLSGKQIQAALERAVSMYPSKNPSFLQISGIEVKFNPDAETGQRIQSVSVGGSALNQSQTYKVGMPTNLAKGGLGFFTVWKKEAIHATYTEMTLETLLKGKSGSNEEKRWINSAD